MESNITSKIDESFDGLGRIKTNELHTVVFFTLGIILQTSVQVQDIILQTPVQFKRLPNKYYRSILNGIVYHTIMPVLQKIYETPLSATLMDG